ncbi:unnamed protein product [Didymodactylos carnosus]|uniref:Uncharacterized protein n=1 Tax=Didymodactylos carnosus TaxID=1234261 RepID=A0A813QL65_9BILA|nr:unnamed protein product [Didymodactylos carnosus]CAF0768466.1 unnamed protein product [Didymodactylos carnosus]CAF3539388.1 unnamed protein product [Didymodactylos carnosus]CAF3550280.1 unnamed protein product [Didymodactylos carnosus]
MAWDVFQKIRRVLKFKSCRMIIMLALTVFIALAEIIFGIRVHSQLLIADGLFSFAEGIALAGALLALRFAQEERKLQRNTFGWARLELLAGLLQEVLLLSLSLSIIVDAINKIINPGHVEQPVVMIVLGSVGAAIGILGMIMFRGYHHDHNIEYEIVEKRKDDFVKSVHDTLQHDIIEDHSQSHDVGNGKVIEEMVIPQLIVHESIEEEQSLINEQQQTPYSLDLSTEDEEHHQKIELIENTDNNPLKIPTIYSRSSSRTSTYTHQTDCLDDEQFEESRIYATLHALRLHSLAVLLESLIVLLSGLLNLFVPNKDENKNDINLWLKYVDPSLTLLMVIVIAIKAVPVVWSLGHILVESVPAGIKTEQLMQSILKGIPQIRAVHNFHVWRATAKDVFASIHLVCDDDVLLSTQTQIFGRQLKTIFETHCIRHFTLQFEYNTKDINRCVYGMRKQRGHYLTTQRKPNIEDVQISTKDNLSICNNSQVENEMKAF